MAALWKAPFVLVVENNQYAYSTPLSQELARPEIVAHAIAYDIPGARIDGNDVEEVHRTVSGAVERARSGGGPTLVEAVTMRMLGHAIHDGAEYVPRELLEEWEQKDPLVRHRTRMLESGNVSEEQLDRIDREAKARIEQAIKAAEAAPLPDPSSLTDGVWA